MTEGLAACVQIVGVRSRYLWKGEARREDEQLLLIKTAAAFEDVRTRLRTIHPYETPEIIAIPATEADADYLAWVEAARA